MSAYYAALISLKNTLHYILHSRRLILISRSAEILQVAYKELQLSERILQRLDESSKSKSRKKVNVLDGRIKDIIWNFEDLLESLLSHQITLQRDESEGDVLLFSIDLQSLQDDVDSFIHTLKDMKEDYIYEVDNMPEDEDEDGDESASDAGTCGETKPKTVGLFDQLKRVKEILLTRDEYWGNIYAHALVGMAGVGKTTLAREIYEDPEVEAYFERSIWITVGRKSSPRLSLGEVKVDEKCLIVLDDVWETHDLSSLLTSILEMKNKIIRILLTARDQDVIACVQEAISAIRSEVVPFLNEEESKILLCHRVFGENSICPPQLVKAATKIAKKCEGLPLTIVTVADLLSRAQNNDPDYLEDVAEERNSVFKDAYAEISKVLYPSYDYLPQRVKMPFLHMGVFPRDCEIPLSKIINMVKAEGWFLDPDKQDDTAEESVQSCLAQLCTSHYLVLCKPKSNWRFMNIPLAMIKTCRLHSSWRYLCRREARNNKLYHVLNRLVDASEEDIKGQRCLCLENNLLFSITEFSNSVRLLSATSTRSLLFSGPYHQYPTPIDAIGFKLLRELDALQLRFYTFPTQVVALVQLKYLALTCNGKLPPTISKLFNLQTLIIHPHTSIIRSCDTDTDTASSSSSSHIPIEIWDMKELEHIEIVGKSLPPPPKHANSLEKLSTLVRVNAASISSIFKTTPFIRKLGVQVELTPSDDEARNSSDPIQSCFAHISELKHLETLKCGIINPVLHQHVRSGCSWMLPKYLTKLHLSGMGFQWDDKYMDVISSLPCLTVLKLRCYAFRGPKWEARGGSFRSLEYLLVEDSDLVLWKPEKRSFPQLHYLSFKHCFKLKELQWKSKYANIELVNCNPLVATYANKLLRKGYFSSVTASNHFEP